MERRAAIIGGSVAGLATAIGLARRGWEVTVVERDLAPGTDDGDEAFLVWDRRNVPQFRQPHAFSARSRNLLMQYVPEAVAWMVADGIEETNLFKMLAPPEMWTPEDDAYTGLWTRRPAFELAIRRIAERETGVTILAPAIVADLVTSERDGDSPVEVTGIVLSDGTRIEADLVIDGGGRRSPVAAWLARRGVETPYDVQDCDGVYYARYYRLQPGAPLSIFGTLTLREEIGDIALIGFPGDHGTFGLGAFALPDDEDMKVLRHTWAWDALLKSRPVFAPWVDPANSAPLTPPEFMGGHQNIRRYYVSDGHPLALRLLSVGDALCTTNPVYGWGASMALTYAFAAVDAATDLIDDPVAMALAYDAAVRDEADAVYRESAAMDRVRTYRWRKQEIPEWDRAEVERQELIFCIAAGALRDPVLGRAQLRRTNLIESPGSVLDDPLVVERARNTQAILAAKVPPVGAPTRGDLLAVIEAARPG